MSWVSAVAPDPARSVSIQYMYSVTFLKLEIYLSPRILGKASDTLNHMRQVTGCAEGSRGRKGYGAGQRWRPSADSPQVAKKPQPNLPALTKLGSLKGLQRTTPAKVNVMPIGFPKESSDLKVESLRVWSGWTWTFSELLIMKLQKL